MFDSFKTPDENLETIFARQKEEALNFVMDGANHPETIEGRIDQGILKLVEKLNSLPFLFTTKLGSCEGHAKDRGTNNIKYFPGYITFETNGSPLSNEFVDEVKMIASKFPEAFFERIDPSEYGGYKYISGAFRVNFDSKEKNGVVFPKEEALRFEAKGKEIIQELEDLTDKFSS